jgi:hypothetical protein
MKLVKNRLLVQATTALIAAGVISTSSCAPPSASERTRIGSSPAINVRDLTRRLEENIAVHDGFLFVRDPSMPDLDLAILPANSPWILHCGVGIWLAFGDGSDEGASGVGVALATTVVNKTTCDALGLRLAKIITRLVSP